MVEDSLRTPIGAMKLATATPTWSSALITGELLVGLTVALVAIPQCIGFASIAGLPAGAGIASAVAMGLVSAVVSHSPRLVIGPAITSSTMLLAILRTVEPSGSASWPALAALVAVLVGIITAVGALVHVGRLIRFVSRSVIVGLIVGSTLLTFGSQLPAALGLHGGAEPTLAGMLWHTITKLPEFSWIALGMAAGVFVFVRFGARWNPRFPAAFVALLLSAGSEYLLERSGVLPPPQDAPTSWSHWIGIALPRPNEGLTNLLVGAVAISLVGMIQNLSIGKALVQKRGDDFSPQRELWSLGLANIAAGAVQGFPGSGSFARSSLADLAGARTRLSSVVAALATGGIAAAAAPLMHYINPPAIAGLLMATALGMIDWDELRALARDAHDRLVLGTMVLGVLVMPIHWALLIGLAVSFIILLRRVSRIHLFEMVRSAAGPFREQDIDGQTGTSAITMIQVEGPLFFAHADQLAKQMRHILRRGPRVVILRMRRTQQIDFSILASLRLPILDYLDSGGHLIICGLTPSMRREILNHPVGEIIGSDFLLETTREVFGSAHAALGLAQCILDVTPMPDRQMFRAEAAERRMS